MSNIILLDQNTINKIAAGEVIERPAAVVKELIENAIDAGANAITTEIKEGGISFIRITDNGKGILKEDLKVAFLRHATSKIKTIEDLISVSSLGFRGEALSSIASVAQVELVTKVSSSLMGSRYLIEGGAEKSIEDIGCPNGTTFIIRNLFYNTPARRKFLKSQSVESSYISELIERLAVSHPNVSFKFITNNKIKLHTSGNGNLKDIIYNIYGREVAANLLEVKGSCDNLTINGFIGKPVVSRGNRAYENYYINGRYIKSSVISKAIEEAYRPFAMSNRYPFTALHFHINSELIDVNVHPTKMELRFTNGDEVYKFTHSIITQVLSKKEMIPEVSLVKEEAKITYKNIPEPFEVNRMNRINDFKKDQNDIIMDMEGVLDKDKNKEINKDINTTWNQDTIVSEGAVSYNNSFNQLTIFEDELLTPGALKQHRIIGQLFSTYWLVQFADKMFIIDQHAAHEKVLFEKTMNSLKDKEVSSQVINPPIILSLSMREEDQLKQHMDVFTQIGFEIEHFGGKEYSVRAVPNNMLGIAQKELLIEMIDSISDELSNVSSNLILEKVASMSCKAAVKGNNKLSIEEATALIDQLLELDNPYHCPHGRPTIISMSKYEIEKKFKRII